MTFYNVNYQQLSILMCHLSVIFVFRRVTKSTLTNERMSSFEMWEDSEDRTCQCLTADINDIYCIVKIKVWWKLIKKLINRLFSIRIIRNTVVICKCVCRVWCVCVCVLEEVSDHSHSESGLLSSCVIFRFCVTWSTAAIITVGPARESLPLELWAAESVGAEYWPLKRARLCRAVKSVA